ncbi:MAG: hypothetical protein RSC09_06595 [Clostridia bacterium]
MKKEKIIYICIAAIALVGFMFYIDTICVKNNKKPAFCLEVKTFEDGKSKEYVGIGYKVFKYVASEEANIYNYELASIFTKLDKSKILELNKDNQIVEHGISFKEKALKSTSRELNKDKYPLGDVLLSTADIATFVTPQNKEDIKEYTKSFFKKNVLVACLVQEETAGVTYTVDSVFKKDSLVTVNVTRSGKSSEAAIEHNYIMLSVDKEMFKEESYSVKVNIK